MDGQENQSRVEGVRSFGGFGHERRCGGVSHGTPRRST